MFNEELQGKISSTTSKSVPASSDKKGIDNSKGFLRVKVVSDSIDYEIINKSFPQVHTMLTTMSPIPFDTIGFNGSDYFDGFGFMMKMTPEQSELDGMPPLPTFEYRKVKLQRIDIKVAMNIPTYTFTLDIPIDNPHIDMFIKYHNINIDFTIIGAKMMKEKEEFEQQEKLL